MDDRVDTTIREWRNRHPDLDFTTLEVVARVLRAAHHLQSRLDEVAAAYGLSHTGDLDVLLDLDRAGPPHQRTPSELAEAQQVTAGGMTVRLNRLQKAGLVDRRPNPNDGRGVLVRLTSLGRDLAEDALPHVIETQVRAVEDLGTADRSHLADLLRELLLTLGDAPALRPAIVVSRVRR
ncbi:MAG: MarR family transcriptional regulator [Acidimicrobiia bacterium]